MPKWNRPLWRSANNIVAALDDVRQTEMRPSLPLQATAGLLRLQSQMADAQERGWTTAERLTRQTLRTRLQWFVNDLQRHLTDLVEPPPVPVPRAGDLYRDLLALKAEFKEVTVNEKATTVVAHTERIVLEEIDLGPFAIVWNWSQIGEDRELRVLPQEPHYAASGDEVCHPHVRREELCLGEAAVPLERAFRAGRLLDAFLIVRQVLQTYNDGSPYVALRDWSGTHCDWCDESLTESSAWICDRCGTDLCDDCRDACARCGTTLCHRCQSTCPECGDIVCAACRPLVGSHRSPLCQTCHDQSENEEPGDEEPDDNEPDGEPSEPPSPTADGNKSPPAVLPHGVGEALVSARRGGDGDRSLRDQSP